MRTKRRRFSADFKAKIALEVLRGEQTVAELAARPCIHPNQMAKWKRQAIDELAAVFHGKTPDEAYAIEPMTEKLAA